MNINFNGFGFDTFNLGNSCDIEIILGTVIIERTSIPQMLMQHQFMSVVQNLAKDQRPMKAICYRTEYTEDSDKEIRNSLTYKNNSYINAFGEN